MPDIMHLVTIDAAPDRGFDALATGEGVRDWWTRDAYLNARLGGVGEFRFMTVPRSQRLQLPS